MSSLRLVRQFCRELRASLGVMTENLERSGRLRLYGDPRVVEDLGIAAAKAGLTVDEVEAAVRVYRRAEWFEMEGRSLVGMYRDIERLQKVETAVAEYRRTLDRLELIRTINTIISPNTRGERRGKEQP